jgi:hypothetical protein
MDDGQKHPELGRYPALEATLRKVSGDAFETVYAQLTAFAREVAEEQVVAQSARLREAARHFVSQQEGRQTR